MEVTPPKLTSPPKIHSHLKTITAKAPKWKEKISVGQDMRHPNIQLLDGAILIKEKNTTYPLPRNTH